LQPHASYAEIATVTPVWEVEVEDGFDRLRGFPEPVRF
jgi:hypothetical protein